MKIKKVSMRSGIKILNDLLAQARQKQKLKERIEID
jgi:hypothetical protein